MVKGRVLIAEQLCKGCELCPTVCPFNLLKMADQYTVTGYRPAELVDPTHRCTGCMLCAMICPDAAITVFRDVKVAAVHSSNVEAEP